MKIANIIFSKPFGGMEQAFINYDKILKMNGHEVVNIVSSRAKYIDRIDPQNLHIIHNIFGFHDYYAAYKIARLIKNHKIDLIIAHGARATVLAKLLHSVKILAVCHSNNVSRIYQSDGVIAINRRMVEDLVALRGSHDSIFTIPNIVNISPTIFSLQKKEVFTVGTLSRLDNTKGIDRVIYAVKRLKDDGEAVRLLIAGNGDYAIELHKLIVKLNLAAEITMENRIYDRAEFFNQIDLFCLPSHNEPFGIVLLEAAYFEKPIIATNCFGPSEIITHEKNGLLITQEQEETSVINDIADAILRLKNDTNIAKQLAKSAKDELLPRYDIRKVAADLERAICKMF